MLSTVDPPVMHVTQTCIYYEPASCVDQCYWANQKDTGPYVFGIIGKGDCGANHYATSDQYNIGVGTIWQEGTKAVYIAGLNISETKDQKYCCVSNKYKVTVGSCAGGSGTAGGYIYKSTGTGDIPARPLDISTLGKANPIVRQFDEYLKHPSPDYDYRIYICGTEVDPASTCEPAENGTELELTSSTSSVNCEKTMTTTANPISKVDATAVLDVATMVPTTPVNGVCPRGYQLLSTVDPPVMHVTQTCVYYEPASSVDQCYWANQGDTGHYIFGTFGSGDCGKNNYGSSDQYNIGIGTIWQEGTKAVYIAGLNMSETKDQKYCCVSNKYKVTVGSCAGGSANAGGYTYNSAGTGDIPAGPLDISTLGKANSIVRQFDDDFKYPSPNYDYIIYVCGTEDVENGTELEPTSSTNSGNSEKTTTTTTTITTANPISKADANVVLSKNVLTISKIT